MAQEAKIVLESPYKGTWADKLNQTSWPVSATNRTTTTTICKLLEATTLPHPGQPCWEHIYTPDHVHLCWNLTSQPNALLWTLKETICSNLSVTSPIHLSLRMLVNTARRPDYFYSSSHGVRCLEQRMNSSSCHGVRWVVDPSKRTSLRCKSYLLPLRGETIEGIGLESRNITSRRRNP